MAITIDIREDALYQEGRLEGKEETALGMLREGFPEEVVTRITKLPAERVAQLRQQLDASAEDALTVTSAGTLAGRILSVPPRHRMHFVAP